MKIKILGNGGAINDGLPYNSFMINNNFLCETPPDIMNSLFREEIDLSKIKFIYISHFHGDHFFGLPFLLLRLFFDSIGKESFDDVTIFGPREIMVRTLELCILAVGDVHPLVNWTEENISFVEIAEGDVFGIEGSISIKVFPMYHYTETYGFMLKRNGESVFLYFADTLWNDRLLDQVREFPKVVLADLNGEPSDPVKVHLSEEDVIGKALPVSGSRTVYYGTHLKYQKESKNPDIIYIKPGDIIDI